MRAEGASQIIILVQDGHVHSGIGKTTRRQQPRNAAANYDGAWCMMILVLMYHIHPR